MEVLVPRKQVKALFYGHTHRWGRKEHEGIHLINLPPVGYLFDKESPNGWAELVLREKGAVLTLQRAGPKTSPGRGDRGVEVAVRRRGLGGPLMPRRQTAAFPYLLRWPRAVCPGHFDMNTQAASYRAERTVKTAADDA
ncbi:MAG: hypothetical protein QM811_31985 [Pirellulales bacterium]